MILASIGLLLEKFLWLDQVDPPFLALLLPRRRSLTRSGWAEWKRLANRIKRKSPASILPPLPLPTSRVILKKNFVVDYSHKPAISTATASNLVVRSRSLFVWKSRRVRGVCDHWKKICRPSYVSEWKGSFRCREILKSKAFGELKPLCRSISLLKEITVFREK